MSAAYENKLQSTLLAQEKEYYFTQCRLMQESVEEMKAYRHDVKLHLATLKDFVADNKVATDYLNSLSDIVEKEVHSTTGNIAFDSIINFKLKNKKNIALDINVLVPPTLNIEAIDVVTIIGNLLDNALTAVEKAEDKFITLTVELNKGNLFIETKNSFDGYVKYEERDGEKVIVTSKKGNRHGYGIKNIKKSTEKYNGHIDISHESNVFSVGVLLYIRH
jgi:sensor histidine kinase regulating citrate/malate metabolism